MKVFFSNLGIMSNQVLLIVNNKTNYLATFESCIFWSTKPFNILQIRPWMKIFTIVDEASVRSTNLKLWNPFEPIWDNVGKLTHFFNEMPSKFSTTYHMKWKQKDYQYKRTFHLNANVFFLKHVFIKSRLKGKTFDFGHKKISHKKSK